MSTVDASHLEVLNQLIQQTSSRIAKRKLRELLLLVTQMYTATLHAAVTEQFREDLDVPLLEEDLLAVEKLMSKGILHNGVVPELSAPDIARAVAIMTTLCIRANCAVLDAEDQQFLEWMFDQAAEEPQQRATARKIEKIVRGGLGLEQRLLWTHKPEAPLS